MATRHKTEGAHLEPIEIVQTDGMRAFEKPPGGLITLRLGERSRTLELSYEEALALKKVMEEVEAYVIAQQWNHGGCC